MAAVIEDEFAGAIRALPLRRASMVPTESLALAEKE